jgi:hypothetical protein
MTLRPSKQASSMLKTKEKGKKENHRAKRTALAPQDSTAACQAQSRKSFIILLTAFPVKAWSKIQ